MSAYYNDNDPKVCAWLRELIRAGLIADGDVDGRSILEIKPSELHGYKQVHFFAGIGGWSYALRLAGIPDDYPIWTGSCPCQPLSCAGQRKGHADERHLWPAFYRLISECRPATIFGEQVASPDGREWLAGIRADMEGIGYAIGSADLCSAGVGSPHPRQRLHWVADSQDSNGRRAIGTHNGGRRIPEARGSGCVGDTLRVGNSNGAGSQQRGQASSGNGHGNTADSTGGNGGVGDTELPKSERHGRNGGEVLPIKEAARLGRSGPWSDFDICHFTGPDAGKTRRIEPGSFPLAHGVPARMVRLRGYGNAINPWLAALFIRASIEAISDQT